jgi:hypothetical protein
MTRAMIAAERLVLLFEGWEEVKESILCFGDIVRESGMLTQEEIGVPPSLLIPAEKLKVPRTELRQWFHAILEGAGWVLYPVAMSETHPSGCYKATALVSRVWERDYPDPKEVA